MIRGYTLVELLIGITVSVLVGGLLLSLLINNTQVSYRESAKVTQGVGANDTVTSIAANIKQASAVASGYPVDNPDYTSNGVTLVLKLPGVDANGDTIIGADDFVVYFLDEDKVRLKVFPSINPESKRNSEDRILTGDATNLQFEYFDEAGMATTPTVATKVKVTVTLETNTLTTEAELRND